MYARFFITASVLVFFVVSGPVQGEVAIPADVSSAQTGTADKVVTPATSRASTSFNLVEEFTAGMLNKGEFKIGTDLDYGLFDRAMIGTDIVSNLVGAPSIQIKISLWESTSTRIAFGLRAAYLTKKTLLWGSMGDHFDELDAKAIRPSLNWDKKISERLTLHTFWAVGVGNVHAKLSEKGRRKLWAQKHPDRTFPEDIKAGEPDNNNSDGDSPIGSSDGVDSKKNQEAAGRDESIITQRSAQVQSITGLAQDRFQITGEFARRSGHRVLISSRVERAEIENLKTQTFRLTVAQHWIFDKFQFRLGGGFQYLEVSGRDLDDEKVEESGWAPATDVVFYWRF